MNDFFEKYFEVKNYGIAVKKIVIFAFVFSILMCVYFDANSFGDIWFWMRSMLLAIGACIVMGLVFRAIEYRFQWNMRHRMWYNHNNLGSVILDDKMNFELVSTILILFLYLGMIIVGIKFYILITGNDGSYYISRDGEYHFPDN